MKDIQIWSLTFDSVVLNYRHYLIRLLLSGGEAVWGRGLCGRHLVCGQSQQSGVPPRHPHSSWRSLLWDADNLITEHGGHDRGLHDAPRQVPAHLRLLQEEWWQDWTKAVDDWRRGAWDHGTQVNIWSEKFNVWCFNIFPFWRQKYLLILNAVCK